MSRNVKETFLAYTKHSDNTKEFFTTIYSITKKIILAFPSIQFFFLIIIWLHVLAFKKLKKKIL